MAGSMLSAQCIAHDLHMIAPWPLQRICWRQFAAQWTDMKNLVLCLSTESLLHYCKYLANSAKQGLKPKYHSGREIKDRERSKNLAGTKMSKQSQSQTMLKVDVCFAWIPAHNSGLVLLTLFIDITFFLHYINCTFCLWSVRLSHIRQMPDWAN